MFDLSPFSVRQNSRYMRSKFVEQDPRLERQVRCAGIQCDDRGRSSVPLRQHTLEPAGGDVLQRQLRT